MEKYMSIALSEDEIANLSNKGLTVRAVWDDETEKEYWYVDGIQSTNTVYYNTPKEAYESTLYSKPDNWPSPEVMARFNYLRKVFDNLQKDRLEREG